MMTESYENVDLVMPFYGNGSREGSNIPFNFEIIKNMSNATEQECKLGCK
jgi:hypothetical protein